MKLCFLFEDFFVLNVMFKILIWDFGSINQYRKLDGQIVIKFFVGFELMYFVKFFI